MDIIDFANIPCTSGALEYLRRSSLKDLCTQAVFESIRSTGKERVLEALKNPAAYPMEDKKKGWIGSDLVFDIDYDHLKRPTLREAKKQIEKLMLILKDDLRFRKLLYVDSGSRGFHIHVYDELRAEIGKS
ncbi:MAG: hypothetical protein J5U17_04000 [Candidatus Methanoperedens sp.]|nr:hypothetical protein [Candidatus Methanoperedens sp.]